MKKSSEEMFEELGFRKVPVIDPISGEEYEHDIEYMKWDGSWEEHILINNSTKLIHISNMLFGKEKGFLLTKEKLQAINKQVEELGWIDGELVC